MSKLAVKTDDALIALDKVNLMLVSKSLYEFVKQAWRVVEPETPFVDNWHIRAICDHLQEVSNGKKIKKLLINVPPGTMKSLLVSVFRSFRLL